MDPSWLDPIEKKLEEGLKAILTYNLPVPKQMSQEESDQSWKDLHDLLFHKYNILNLDLPGNPRDPYKGEVNYPYPEVYQQRYGVPYKP